MSKIAVIKTGGKQYKVQAGDVLKVEKLPGEKAGKVTFAEVFLVADGEKVEVGQPTVGGKTVTAEILEQGIDKKIRVIKYKAKTRYKKVHGHRQHFTKVKITAI